MTISALINKIKEEKPNTFTDEKLLSFINEIEWETAEDLCVQFEPYEDVDDTELLVPEPYSRTATATSSCRNTTHACR